MFNITYAQTKFTIDSYDQCQPALRKFLFTCASPFFCFHQCYGLSFQMLPSPVWTLRVYMFSKSSKPVNTGLPVQITVLELQVHIVPGACPASPYVQEDFQILCCPHKPLRDTRFNAIRLLHLPCRVLPFILPQFSA